MAVTKINQVVVDTLGNAVTLTDAVERLPVPQGQFGDNSVFSSEGVPTTKVAINESNGKLILVDDTSRDDTPKNVGKDKPRSITLETMHLPLEDTLRADDLQDRFTMGGGSSSDAALDAINKKMLRLKSSIAVTKEFHRLGAVQGMLRNKEGGKIYDFYEIFGLERRRKEFVATDEKQKLRQLLMPILREGEKQLHDQMNIKWKCVCSGQFFDWLVDHLSVQKTYEGWAAAREQGGGDVRKGFVFAGIEWTDYNINIGGTDFIKSGEAHLYPSGGMGIFNEVHAPANYMSTVNTMGLEYYAMAEPLPMDKGYKVEVQSNPLPWCAYPGALTTFALK